MIIEPTFVLAQFSDQSLEDNYREMTYDQIVNELNIRRNKISNQPITKDPFDEVKINLGIGYINSFSTIKVNTGQFQRYQNGLQLGVGMDLFDPEWFTELNFRNFGITGQGNEELMLKEFNLKIGYLTAESLGQKGPWHYFFATGISNRFLHYTNRLTNVSVDNTTPSLLGSFGLRAKMDKHLSFGIEIMGRSALIGTTSDTSSVDYTFRIDTSL